MASTVSRAGGAREFKSAKVVENDEIRSVYAYTKRADDGDVVFVPAAALENDSFVDQLVVSRTGNRNVEVCKNHRYYLSC